MSQGQLILTMMSYTCRFQAHAVSSMAFDQQQPHPLNNDPIHSSSISSQSCLPTLYHTVRTNLVFFQNLNFLQKYLFQAFRKQKKRQNIGKTTFDGQLKFRKSQIFFIAALSFHFANEELIWIFIFFGKNEFLIKSSFYNISQNCQL